MGLLGKTLKGRTTRTDIAASEGNVILKLVQLTKEEYENEHNLNKVKKDYLDNGIRSEVMIAKLNRQKLATYWRKILRIAKTEEFKNELEIYSQNNQRELDSKEAFLQMLDKNLDEAEDQYSLALRNHLLHLEKFLEIQKSREFGLKEQWEADVEDLKEEFRTEAHDIMTTYKRQETELKELSEVMKKEEDMKTQIAKENFQNAKEDLKDKGQEEIDIMNSDMNSKHLNLTTNLENLYQKYQNDTKHKFTQYDKLLQENTLTYRRIEDMMKKIARTQDRIQLRTLKIFQMQKEFDMKNQALNKEREAVNANFLALKNKMFRFREDRERKLTELISNSKQAVTKLQGYLELGEKILKTSELCRRLETEKEKVLPFYETTVGETEIPEDLQEAFKEISPEDYHSFAYLNNFFKRYNKVMLDKLAIEKQKETLTSENGKLKNLLKQYIDGISVNDEVLDHNNPLLVIQDRVNIKKPPAEFIEPGSTTKVEGNFVVRAYNMHKNPY